VLEDLSGRVRAKLKEDRIEQYSELLRRGESVLIAGKVSFPPSDDEDAEREPTLLVDTVEPLAAAAQKVTRAIGIRMQADRIEREDITVLGEILEQNPGSCNVELFLGFDDGCEAQFLVDRRRVSPTDHLMSVLERRFGYDSVELL
jgi:DNA polymerase III alpha subunit